jgi:hypothetical protein
MMADMATARSRRALQEDNLSSARAGSDLGRLFIGKREEAGDLRFPN